MVDLGGMYAILRCQFINGFLFMNSLDCYFHFKVSIVCFSYVRHSTLPFMLRFYILIDGLEYG